MLFVLGCGIRGGPRAGLLATAGVATSDALHVAVAAAGLAALFAAVPAAFTVVRIAGAAYLTYLGVQTIRRRGRGLADAQPATAGVSDRRNSSSTVPSGCSRGGSDNGCSDGAASTGLDVATGGIFIGPGARLAVER